MCVRYEVYVRERDLRDTDEFVDSLQDLSEVTGLYYQREVG